MNQGSLFSGTNAFGEIIIAAPAQRHSETSVAAAAQIEPVANEMHVRILKRLREAGEYGCTDEELTVDFTGGSTERPRRRELQKLGLIRDSGKTRKTASGRAAVVWVLDRY